MIKAAKMKIVSLNSATLTDERLPGMKKLFLHPVNHD